jgi:flagellar motor switch protein FliM
MESPEQNLPEQDATLSQQEVQRLLGQLAEATPEPEVKKEVRKETHGDEVQPYDFRNPILLSNSDLRKLRGRHEEFVQALEGRLSTYLRLEFSLKLSRLQTLTYQKFSSSLNNPTHITMFKVEPLRGICLMDVSPQLGLTIVDRLMGGPGHPASVNRDLSEIEVALLDQAVQIVVGEWTNLWPEIKEPRPVMLGHENNSRFLQTSPPDTVMMVLSMEAGIGDYVETIQLAFPYAMLEPLMENLRARANAVDDTGALRSESQPRWRRDYEDVVVPITAEWPSLEMTARELVNLEVGQILEVAPEFANDVQVRLAGMSKFVGRLGTRGGQWAVEISQVRKADK